MKGFEKLIAISAREKESIIQKVPDIHIYRTVKQKSKRHRYYMEENKSAMRVLKELRGHGRKGD